MKIKLPRMFQAKRKKLRATAVRKPLRIAATADYEEMAEPNMKLSRALLIVLVLHIVAVSGIIAFNAIKTRQGPILPVALPTATSSHGNPTVSATETAARGEPKSARSPAKGSPREERKAEHARTAGLADSGKVYVVAKGDNPVSIAKRLKVPYDDLLAINHIDDPHKLKVGQKLIIPSKPPKARKVDE